MVDFFAFFDLERKFHIDEAELKKRYFQKSKEFHPDFFQNDPDKYDEALELSSINNTGYKTLKSFDGRLKYILELEGFLSGNQELPQSFLMEMMDVNEAIMELQMGELNDAGESVLLEVKNRESQLESRNKRLSKQSDEESDQETRKDILNQLKENYLKQKYVLRMKENIDKFASF